MTIMEKGTTEKQLELLTRLNLAESEEQRQALREALRRTLELPQAPELDAEVRIRALLLKLGAPDHLVGHPYVVEAILLVVEDRRYINNITFGLYPQVAVKFDTTAARVERAIRHLIEVTWLRSDVDVLVEYFGNTVSMDRGKPTNGEFIARLANIVKEQLRMAA